MRRRREPHLDELDEVPQASVLDTVRVAARVLVPLVGRGLIVRRPPFVALAERLDLDRRAVHELQRLRHRYGAGPLLLRLPVRRLALALEPSHVRRILDESPDPFSPANLEKRHALGQFEPAGVLISEGSERADRRRFNEAVLDTPEPVHRQAPELLAKLREEAGEILRVAERQGELTWDAFAIGWYRMFRRVTLGDAARDDHELTDLLGSLRASANWSYFRRKDRERRRRFLERLRSRMESAEPGSLAGAMHDVPSTDATAAHQQIPQWLFAFDPAGIATFRALALLASHPEELARVRDDELAGRDPGVPAELPRLRATVLESLRLWPTTPGVLRDTTTITHWDRGALPTGSGLVVFAPFFHRDDQRFPQANHFAPDLWSSPDAATDWPLIPFSSGPAVCPGRNLVLLLTSMMLAELLTDHEFELHPAGRLDPGRDLPSVLSPYDLRFRMARRGA